MKQTIKLALMAGVMSLAFAVPNLYAASSNPCNPCNPCAAKNPCNPCNPCAAKNPCNPCNPCAAKNPCNPCNPCAAGGGKIDSKMVARPSGSELKLGSAESGEKLFNDNKLSTNGLTCNTCHQNGASYGDTFSQPYPHKVKMAAQKTGMDSVDVDEMVQLCMVVPMANKPLAWDSSELADLSAYVLKVQDTWEQAAATNPCNPCAAKNPCNPCNPCAAKNPCNPCNPCAAKNPCNPCNPCAAKNPCNPCNPCAAKNPCNPCAGTSN